MRDTVIVGGGLVGATLALALAAHGLSSTIVDAADLEATRTLGFDGRVSAIASASARMFRAIGLGDVLDTDGCAIGEIRVTDGLSPLHLHFDAREGATGPLGWMVENHKLRGAVLDAIAAEPLIRLLAPARVGATERGAAVVRVETSMGEVRAPLLIAADGKRSPLRDAAGIRMAAWDYPATAIVTTLRHAEPHGNIAFELFYPTGPFAILPMLDDDHGHHRSAIVWTVPAADAPGWLALTPAALARAMAGKMDHFLGTLEIATPVSAYPLRLQHAEVLVADRLALVGDSAHAIHPIAGQGLNLGLRDVAALTQVLVESARLGLDLGSPAVLARYQAWRRLDIAAITVATDLLARLFGLEGVAATTVRRLGLAGVNRLPRLKRAFMAEARGEAGALPKLLTGELV